MTAKQIEYAFNGKLVGRKILKYYVCRTLLKMPTEIVDYVTKKCWFMGSFEDAWGFAFTGNDLKNQHLIFLSDDLFDQNAEEIYFSIAHEIGHVILKHENSVVNNQSKEEIRKQEKEANEFAKLYS